MFNKYPLTSSGGAHFVPFQNFPCRFDHTLFGRNASWFHVTNVLLHTIASVLFTRVCTVVAGLRRNFATLAGVLFAVHPIHTEAVSVERVFGNYSDFRVDGKWELDTK